MKALARSYKYILLFIFFLLVLLLFGNVDIIWNYGFSHAIRIGEVPYKDFNMISTPLYAFLLSIGLFIKDTYFVFLMEQALMCTLLIFIVNKMFGKNYLVVLVSLCFPIYNLLFPNYNFFCLFLLILLLYFEKSKKSDALIGIFLGFIILTKHTIGIVVLFFSLLGTFNLSRSVKRFLFSLIPLCIFFLYLIISNSFTSFINLSVLGLFDFGKSNISISLFSIVVSICILAYAIFSIHKDRKNIYNYYLLSSFSFIIPICDFAHVFYLICIFIIILLFNNISINKNKLIFISVLLMMLIFIINGSLNFNLINGVYNNKLKYFSIMPFDKGRIDYINKVSNKYSSYKPSKMIAMSSMFFDIENNNKIDYFDVPLYGNFGYNGLDNMKRKIDQCHKCYFFISDSDNNQFARELNDYIRDNYSCVEAFEDFEIYKVE